MSFDGKHYPNRKDWRRPYRKSARFDASCRPGGSCGYCRNNRMHRHVKADASTSLLDVDDAIDSHHRAKIDAEDDWYFHCERWDEPLGPDHDELTTEPLRVTLLELVR